MKTTGDKLKPLEVAGIKPRFSNHGEDDGSTFESITETSFPGK